MASNAGAVLAAGWCAMASRNTGTTLMDGAWHLVVVGVVDWFYLMVINADVKPSQSAGTGDWAGCAACSGGWCAMALRNTGTARMDGAWCLVVVGVVSVFSMNCLSGLVVL